jgi:glycosyltransferase involved in cell wall biosynthesis
MRATRGEAMQSKQPSRRAQHIGILLHSLGPGGAQQRVVWFANRFAELGRSVDLLTFDHHGTLAAELSPAVRLIELGLPRWPVNALRMRSAMRSIATYLRSERPDVLLSGANRVHLVAAEARKQSGDHSALVLRVSNQGPRNKLSRRLLLRARPRRKLFGRADGIVAVCEDIAATLRAIHALPSERIDVIYNPTAKAELFAVGSTIDRTHARAANPLIVAAGRFCAQKDFETLVRAFAIVRAARPARLALLGDGPHRLRLEHLIRTLRIERDVELPGWVDDIPDWLRRADLLVSSSRWEGLQATLIEALALGCPVVATDCPGGNREILENGALGPLVPPGDASALSEAILASLEAPAEPERLRLSARRFAEEGKAEAYLDVLDRCARRTSSSQSDVSMS